MGGGKKLPKKKIYAYISKLPKRISSFQLRGFFSFFKRPLLNLKKKKKVKLISVNAFRHMNFISLNLTGPWGSNLFRGPSNCLPNLSRVTHTHCPHLSQPHPLQTSLCSLPSLTTESLPHDNESPIHSPWALRTWHSCLLFPPSTYISPVCLLVYLCVQLLSHVQLFAAPWTAAYQAFLSFTIPQSLLRFMSIEAVMLSNHLRLCCPLFLLPSIFPSISLFQWVSSSYQVAEVSELQLQHQPFQWIFRVDFL